MKLRESHRIDIKKYTPKALLVRYATEGYIHSTSIDKEAHWKVILLRLFGPLLEQPGGQYFTDVKYCEDFDQQSHSQSSTPIPEHSDGPHKEDPVGALSLFCKDTGDDLVPTKIVDLHKFITTLPPEILNKYSNVEVKWVNDFSSEYYYSPIFAVQDGRLVIRYSYNIALLGCSSPDAALSANAFFHAKCDPDLYYLAALLHAYCQNPENQILVHLKKGEFVVFNNQRFVHLVDEKPVPRSGSTSGRWLLRAFCSGAGLTINKNKLLGLNQDAILQLTHNGEV